MKKQVFIKVVLFLLVALISLVAKSQIWESFDFKHEKGGEPFNLTTCNDKLFFSYNDGVHGYELWVSDGTLDGSKMVKDIFVGPQFSNPSNMRVLNDKIIFEAHSRPKPNFNITELWISDGTESGTKSIKSINSLFSDSSFESYIVVHDKFYFTNFDDANGFELWSVNLDFTDLKLIKDINPGPNSSSISSFFYYDDKVFFTANDGIHGQELWVTDGTETGTYLFKDINPGGLSSSPSDFLVYQDKVYFSANNGVVGNELWITDGTDTGTSLLIDINPGSLGSNPQKFRVVNDKFVFSAQHEIFGFKLWFSDGSPSGTYHISKMTPRFDMPSTLVVYENKVVLCASSHSSGKELWISDGTEQGTLLIKDIYPTNSSSPLGLTVYRNKVYFSAVSHLQNRGFWVTDGTEVGTRSIAPTEFNSNNPLELTHYFVVFDSSLFFKARFYPYGERIWKYTYDPNNSLQVSLPFSENIQIQLYPNPTSGTFKIVGTLDKPFTGLVSIKDIHGREVLVKEVKDKIDFNEELDLTGFHSGVYFIRIVSNESDFFTKTLKVIKQ